MPPRRLVTGRSHEPGRRFAEELRALRTRRGDSLRGLGERLGWDWSLFGKIEKGETLGGPEVAQALDHHYGTEGLLLTLWELAAGDPTRFRERYRRYMVLESEALSMHMYAPCTVPGLLQTEVYAREMLSLGGLMNKEELEQQVCARLQRQEVLSGGHTTFRAVLDEAVLRRALAEKEAWEVQLLHLLERAKEPHVTLQVLPFTVGLREMSATDATFLRLPDGRTAAWVETGYSGELVTDATAVESLQVAYDRLRDHALSPDDSAGFIAAVMEEVTCQ